MARIDRLMKVKKVTPVFFHGSGGSIDRGGGSVRDQMAAWPDSAKRAYKATIQGEMVERTFSSPEIAMSRFFQILDSAASKGSVYQDSKELNEFADRVGSHYRDTIASERFLKMVERATPYRYLSALKIGSRPSKRGGSLSVPALRAIPWVLCWTQTRVLFQTWWGVGTAWKNSSSSERKKLKAVFETNPLFRTYLQALGFTLAKVEMPIWDFYLAQSGIEPSERKYFSDLFHDEFEATFKFFREITGEKNPLWFRPWLGESIELRAAMIHPLNLLEIIAQEKKDLELLRLSVTGIATGMLTTG
ncbi:MAG: phosphoenolpyruvate carboxylase [Proteobacteria bacterium]|nr:MAG: phosphoenolpyruvate carboxylase [Pseudomonadota bacterium]